MLSYEARAKGLAFLGIIAQMASLINTFGLPVALEKLTWKGKANSFSRDRRLFTPSNSLPDLLVLGCLRGGDHLFLRRRDEGLYIGGNRRDL